MMIFRVRRGHLEFIELFPLLLYSDLIDVNNYKFKCFRIFDNDNN